MLRPEVVTDLVCEGDVGGGEQRVVPEGDVAWGNQISAVKRSIGSTTGCTITEKGLLLVESAY